MFYKFTLLVVSVSYSILGFKTLNYLLPERITLQAVIPPMNSNPYERIEFL